MKLDIPNLEAVRPGIEPQHCKELLVAALYHAGEISSKEACDIIGINRYQFENLLPTLGFSVMPDDDVTIANELTQ